MVNNYDFKTVTRLRMLCMKVLPTVYGDALSYEEQVCKVTEKINELVNTVNSLPDYIINIVKELIESAGLEDIVKNVLADLYFINVKNPPVTLSPAIGDGITNDTAAIQAMINYAAEKRSYLFFPSGTYIVSGLTMVENVSLVGLNRYSTIITLAPQSNKDLITGFIENATISNITLNANMNAQTANCSCFNATVENAYIDSVIYKNGYNSVVIESTNEFNGAFWLIDGIQHNAITINGDGAIIDNITFKNASQLSANALAIINGNNKITGIFSNVSIPNGVIISAVGATIEGTIINAETTIKGGSGNYINIIDSSGNIVYGTNINETITENMTTNAKNNIENITDSKTVNAKDIILNATNPLTYSKPIEIRDGFGSIPMKSSDNTPYWIITSNDGTIPFNEFEGQELNVLNQAKYRITDTDFLQVQGSCITNDGNIIYAMIPESERAWGKTTAKWIKKSLNTWNTLVENTIDTYHTNSMTYIPETNMVLSPRGPYFTSSGVQTNSNVYSVINAETLLLVETKSVTLIDGTPLMFQSMSYDKNSKTLYLMQDLTAVYTCDMTTNIATKLCDLQVPKPIPTNNQDILVKDGYIYKLMHLPNTLFIFDMTGKLVKIYNLPYWLGDYMYTGEAESIDTFNDDLWLTTFSYENELHNTSSLTFNKMNLTKGVYNGLFNEYGGVTQSTGLNIYVDSNSTSAYENGSQNFPFKSLQSVADLIKIQNPNKVFNVNIATGNYGYTFFNNCNSSCNLVGKENVTIDGLNVVACKYIGVNNVAITNTNNNTYGVRIYHSKVLLANSSINAGNTATAAIGAFETELLLRAVTASGGNNGVYANATNVRGTVTYSSNPQKRIKLENVSTWYVAPRDHITMSVADQDVEMVDNRSKLFPSSFRVKDGAPDFQSGSITIPNISNINHIELTVLFNGKYFNFVAMLGTNSTQNIHASFPSLTENGYLINEIDLSLNMKTGVLTWNKNTTWDGTTITEYSGSDVNRKFGNIRSVFGLNI